MSPDLVKVYFALFAALGVSFVEIKSSAEAIAPALLWSVRFAAPAVVIAFTIWKWRRAARKGKG